MAAANKTQHPFCKYAFTSKHVLWPSKISVKYFCINGFIKSHLSPTINWVNCPISTTAAIIDITKTSKQLQAFKISLIE